MFLGYTYFIYALIILLILIIATAYIIYFTKFRKSKLKGVYFTSLTYISTVVLYAIIILLGLVFSINVLNTTFEGYTALMPVLNSEDECTCYAKCTNDSDIDYKSTYELLFGKINYAIFIETLGLNGEQASEFDLMVTGQDKDAYIIEHLTNNSVDVYRELLEEIGTFKNDDINRLSLSDDALKRDLIKLLSDNKENGRNIHCDVCDVANITELAKDCCGLNHYIEGWSWEEIWESDEEDNNTEYEVSGNLGQATGQYAITTSDGLSYYWYHQTSSSCSCVYCGDWTNMYWGTPGNWHKFGTDGCAVYSLAMIVSNLVGAEITPTKLLIDLGCSIENNYCDTSDSDCFSGRNIIREKAAETVSRIYGIKYSFVNNSAEANDILSGDGMVWDQWKETHSHSDFYWYGGTGHFMAIRELTDNKYYCLTSCGSNGHKHIDIMNYGETPENVFEHSSGGKAIGFWVVSNTEQGTDGINNNIGTINPIPDVVDTDIQADIAAGLYTLEDYNYLVALGGESHTYNGFYAVACCVRNRVERNGTSYKIEVTKENQFSGYHSSEVGNPRNESVKKAAIAVLRGGESTIGDCYFFLGRYKGYDMWAEPGIDKFYNVGNNIYFNAWGDIHNKQKKKTNGAILIYDNASSTWIYPSGTYYTK